MNNKRSKIVIIYFISGVFWIILSHLIIGSSFKGFDSKYLMLLQSAKGMLFIIVTTIVLYFLTKKQQATLHRSEEQYRSLFEGNPNPMWIYSFHNYRFIEVNEAAIEKYGYSREEFLKMTVLDIRPPEDRQNVMSFIEKIKSGKANAGTWTHVKKTGEKFIVSIKSHPVKFNNLDCATVMAIDITEKVTQQKQLEDSYKKEIELNDALASHIELIKKSNSENRRMAEIIDKINNFVIIFEKDGSLRWVNNAFTQFTGYHLNEVEGKIPGDFLFGKNTDPITIDRLIQAISKQEFFSGELINYTKNGEEYWVEVNISPIYDSNGDFDCFISVESVITDRKRREQYIHDQNRTLRQIAWVSSHEIRRPVSSIISLVSLLKSLDDGIQKEECLSLLEEASIELDNLVKDIAKRVNVAEDLNL